MVHYCHMTTVLQFFNITLILRHVVLLQILCCPQVEIEQSYSRICSGHMTIASISLITILCVLFVKYIFRCILFISIYLQSYFGFLFSGQAAEKVFSQYVIAFC